MSHGVSFDMDPVAFMWDTVLWDTVISLVNDRYKSS